MALATAASAASVVSASDKTPVVMEILDITLGDGIEQAYVVPLLRCTLVKALGVALATNSSQPKKPVNMEIFLSSYFEAAAAAGAAYGSGSIMSGNVKLIEPGTGSVMTEINSSIETDDDGIALSRSAGISSVAPLAGTVDTKRSRVEVDPVYLTKVFVGEVVSKLHLQSNAVDAMSCIPEDPETVAWWPPPPPARKETKAAETVVAKPPPPPAACRKAATDSWDDEYAYDSFGKSNTRGPRPIAQGTARVEIKDSFEDEYGGCAFGQSYTRGVKKLFQSQRKATVSDKFENEYGAGTFDQSHAPYTAKRSPSQSQPTQSASVPNAANAAGTARTAPQISASGPRRVEPQTAPSERPQQRQSNNQSTTVASATALRDTVIVFGLEPSIEKAYLRWEQIRKEFPEEIIGFVPAFPTVKSTVGQRYHLIARPNHPSANPARSCSAVQAKGVFCEILPGSFYPE